MPSFPLTNKITADQLRVLLNEFEKIKFYSLEGSYGRVGKPKLGPTCPESATDNPSATITLVSRRKRKTVDHYLGCQGAKILDDLVALEDRIDEIADSKQWTSQFGWGAANVVNLKLQVNPQKPPF